MQFVRMWINQPSTLQPYHEYDGVNVLALVQPDGKTLVTDGKDPNYIRVAFTEGPSISIRIHRMALSSGWRPQSAPPPINPKPFFGRYQYPDQGGEGLDVSRTETETP